MKYDNKIAVITGGAIGIGKATADILSKEGARVLIVNNDLKGAKKASEEINSYAKLESKAYKVDVVNNKQIDIFVTDVINEFKKIDILVHCAGLIDIENTNFIELKE